MPNFLKSYDIDYSYKNNFLKYFSDIGVQCKYKAQDIIEEGNSKLDYIYYIEYGIVKQSFLYSDGKEKTIFILSTGDLIGEITSIQGDSEMVFTQAESNCSLRKIDRSTFFKLIEENPDLNKDIMIMLTTKLRILMFQLHDFTYYNTKANLLNLLIRLSIQHGEPYEDGTLILLNLTHEKIANMINSTRSTVTKLINELEEEKLIRREKVGVIVLTQNRVECFE